MPPVAAGVPRGGSAVRMVPQGLVGYEGARLSRGAGASSGLG